MKSIFNAGNDAQGDCLVTFAAQENSPLEICIESDVQTLYGDAIKAKAAEVCRFFAIESGRLFIRDRSALDFVLTARIEACIRQCLKTDKEYLLPMIPENRYPSSPKRLRLSRLYLPGNTPKMMINAGLHRPHGIILDLEDSVSIDKKEEARLLVRNALCRVDFYGAERMVRINQLPMGLADLVQVIPHGLHVILIPKCESGEAIEAVNSEIEAVKAERRLDREIFLMPIIENSKGVINAADIAAAGTNIIALTIGLEDYTADLGVQRTQDGSESFYARSHLVNVCKAHGLQAIDSVFSDIADLNALKENVCRSKALGFEGMGCIHPRQIKTVHEGYAPDAAEIERAQKIILAFESARQKGLGVVSLGTKMIDKPVVERAQRTIELAIALNRICRDWNEEDV